MLLFISTILMVVVLTSVVCAFISAKKIDNDNFAYCRNEASARCNNDDYEYCNNMR